MSISAAYTERNRLVAFLTRLYPSWIGLLVASDSTWENEWRTIIYIATPAGQMSWHVHDDDLHLFTHLSVDLDRKWDGHTTEQKYERLTALGHMPSIKAMAPLPPFRIKGTPEDGYSAEFAKHVAINRQLAELA